jgi:TonB-dependent SusC/RagA subfamily outer membrane receptor
MWLWTSANILEEIVGLMDFDKEALTGSVSKINAAKEKTAGKFIQCDWRCWARSFGDCSVWTTWSGSDYTYKRIWKFSNSNDALYVVDGIPISGDLSSINTSDIESISILKDESSTALFGNKASNGVVLVTTKKRKKKEGSLKVSMSTGSFQGYKRVWQVKSFRLLWSIWEARA